MNFETECHGVSNRSKLGWNSRVYNVLMLRLENGLPYVQGNPFIVFDNILR